MKKLKLNIDKISDIDNPVTAKQVLKAIIKALLFVIYVYGLIKISPYLFDEIFSIDLFTWLRPIAGSILALIAYGPLVDRLISIIEYFDNDDDNNEEK